MILWGVMRWRDRKNPFPILFSTYGEIGNTRCGIMVTVYILDINKIKIHNIKKQQILIL